jgi:hypothetical protein
MKETIAQWMSVILILVFVYLVVQHGQDAGHVINTLSSANTNAILALQGRAVNPTLG